MDEREGEGGRVGEGEGDRGHMTECTRFQNAKNSLGEVSSALVSTELVQG